MILPPSLSSWACKALDPVSQLALIGERREETNCRHIAANTPAGAVYSTYLDGNTTHAFAGISILSAHFAPGESKNAAFAIVGAGQPIGYIAGLIIGGVLSQSSASWRTIFYLQAGLGCLFCITGWFVIPPDDRSRRYDLGLDLVGAFLSTAGLGLLVCDLAYVFSRSHSAEVC